MIESGTVIQEYIEKVYLIDGYKFDLRLYVLITSMDPLEVYLYDDGLVRLCSKKYEKPNNDNINDKMIHLTNYTVNKESVDFKVKKTV